MDDYIPISRPVIGEREIQLVLQALRAGWISSQGAYVVEFESLFSSYCNTAYGVAVNSGTAAIHLALLSLGVGPGDEVIVPALTHIAVVNMVTLTRARPVLVDSDPVTWTMDPSGVAEKLTPRTKVILPVHVYGHPSDMGPILDLASAHEVFVVEDGAEAHGAEYRGRRIGGLGDVGCFSVYANKVITTGEGGMLVTSNPDLAAKAAKLRDQAYEASRRFWHRERGYNYRLTNVQAAIGVAQLERIEDFISHRRRNASLFASLLRDVPGVTCAPEAVWAKNVYWMFSLLIDERFPCTRDDLIRRLEREAIESHPCFVPVHLQPAYHDVFVGERYKVAERVGTGGLNLPSGNDLTEPEVRRVAKTVRAVAMGLV